MLPCVDMVLIEVHKTVQVGSACQSHPEGTDNTERDDPERRFRG